MNEIFLIPITEIWWQCLECGRRWADDGEVPLVCPQCKSGRLVGVPLEETT